MPNSQKLIYEQALALCKKHKLLPFKSGSAVELVHIQHDELMHDINICFHELGHLYCLNDNDFNLALSIETITDLAPNNIGVFIEQSLTPEKQFSNELYARAIQIGLNIVYDLWPGYNELSGWSSEYPEFLVRQAVANSKTADAVIHIVKDMENLS